MLMCTLRALVNNPVKKSFYGKKKINVFKNLWLISLLFPLTLMLLAKLAINHSELLNCC